MNARITEQMFHEVLALRADGVVLKQISRQTGISLPTIHAMLKGKWVPADQRPPHKTPEYRQRFRRPDWDRKSGRPQPVDPTPEEIAAICAEIRAAWSPEEFATRKSFNPDEPRGWVAPVWSCHENQLVAA